MLTTTDTTPTEAPACRVWHDTREAASLAAIHHVDVFYEQSVWDPLAVTREFSPAEQTASMRCEVATSQSAIEAVASSLFHRMQRELHDDLIAAAKANEPTPSEHALRVCADLARRVSLHVGFAIGVKTGMFLEDDGGLSVVLQSLLTDRRLTIRVHHDATCIDILRTDERLRTEVSRFTDALQITVKERTEWLLTGM